MNNEKSKQVTVISRCIIATLRFFALAMVFCHLTCACTAPNEWYRWENDLRNRPDIQILLSVDSSSFPLGTGPKPHEIWHEGYYPVVWTNRRYRMLYVNMGHNDMDYEGGSNRALSGTFQSEAQNQLILNGLQWLGTGTSIRNRFKN